MHASRSLCLCPCVHVSSYYVYHDISLSLSMTSLSRLVERMSKRRRRFLDCAIQRPQSQHASGKRLGASEGSRHKPAETARVVCGAGEGGEVWHLSGLKRAASKQY